jgi:hypothetical protein
LAWPENTPGGKRQVFVNERVGDAFQPRGVSLNIHQDSGGIGPTIGFAGDNRTVPWTTWYEASPKFGGAANVFASRFNTATGL